MAVDALIFDCDGVLIDSEVVACRIAAEELTKLGYSVDTRQVIARFAGRPDHEMRAEIEVEWGRPIPDSFRNDMNRRTFEAYATELQIMPGIKEALEQISLPMCVASSSFPEKLELGLRTVRLYDRFAPNIISGTSVARGKPAPDVFLFAAGWLRTSPLRCLVVEDSVPGVLAATRAGIPVLGFTGGSHSAADHAERLSMAGAFAVFSDMKELPSLVARCD